MWIKTTVFANTVIVVFCKLRIQCLHKSCLLLYSRLDKEKTFNFVSSLYGYSLKITTLILWRTDIEYADDTTLHENDKSISNIKKKLQIALNNLQEWCKNNGMVLNTTKTKIMLITTRQKRLQYISQKKR